MLTIKNIRIEDNKAYSRLIADIVYNKRTTELWYEVEKANKEYLCYERADAFLVVLLLFAMEKGEDIKIVGTPVTSRLYFNLKKFLIPILSKKIDDYKKIEIICETSSESLDSHNFNGGSISCGIDSFFTIQQNTFADCPSELKINCLTLFNMGSSGDMGGDAARSLFKERITRGKKFSNEYNFQFVYVDSNISEFINMSFLKTHTFRNCSAVLSIQKFFSTYHYSSGHTIFEFGISKNDPSQYDTLILSLLSNGIVTFYPSGSPYNRVEKTRQVTKYLPSYKYLNVCVRDECNCGHCEKCIRTMLTLYGIGQLEKYKEVFNIDDFYKNLNKHFTFMMKKLYVGNHYYKEIYINLKEHNIKINIWIKIIAFFTDYELITKNIPLKLKNKIKKVLKIAEK